MTAVLYVISPSVFNVFKLCCRACLSEEKNPFNSHDCNGQ